MNKIGYTIIFILALLTNSSSLMASDHASWWHDAPSVKWQIEDYARFLHGEKIVMTQDDMDFDNGQHWYFETLDNKGGFAMITGAVDGYKEYVLWRRSDGNDLIGEMAVSCGPACSYDFRFYLGVGESIAKIDFDEILPVAELTKRMERLAKLSNENDPVEYTEDRQLRYVFPQKGTAMDVHIVLGADEFEIKLGKLNWNRMTFTIDYLLEKVEPVN